MNDVSLLIKPASSLCNLRCRYCFYEDESENRLQKCMGLMRQETAERLIDAAFAAQRGSGSITFSFQGGEPTVAGLEFFERFVALVEEKKRRSVRVHYALQTNGMVLDAEWAAFLNKNRFLVGLSVDGDRETHEACRVDAQGKGTYAKAVTPAAKGTGGGEPTVCSHAAMCAQPAKGVQCAQKARCTVSSVYSLPGSIAGAARKPGLLTDTAGLRTVFMHAL